MASNWMYSTNSMNADHTYMARCLELAAKGLGQVAPNPMVGCVIVHNGHIVAEGFHERFGGPHAEPNAIRQLSDDMLKESVLYVNLEPCSHHGKTPPCADLIIAKGIRRVVVGNLDPNPLVAGTGLQKLRDAGVSVTHGVLDKECRELNKRFLTFHEKKRPYIILKWAQTADGFISQWPLPPHKEDNWITGAESKTLSHRWRAQEQAILVGYNTLINDDPLLTTRLSEGNNPLRLILARDAALPSSLNAFNRDAKTIVFNSAKSELRHFVEFVKVDWANKVNDLLDICYKRQIASVIVEGGTNTIYQFMNTGLWDEARVFVNPEKYFSHGIAAPDISLEPGQACTSGSDLLYYLKNESAD